MGLSSELFDQQKIADKLAVTHNLAPANSPLLPNDHLIDGLLAGEMELEGLMPWSSNYTFLAKIQSEQHDDPLLGIYKPGDGERPLWDFPDRTLSLREFTSYLISQILGWPGIPATVLRHGPHGLGSVQLFVDAEYEAHYFNMRNIPAFVEDFRNMAIFDYIVNNADRKGGHCLKDKGGRIWAIDHGLTFHTDPKLRTVIWEFCDDPLPPQQLADLQRLAQLLDEPLLCEVLSDLISEQELQAFKARVERITTAGHFPTLRSGRNMPYPPI